MACYSSDVARFSESGVLGLKVGLRWNPEIFHLRKIHNFKQSAAFNLCLIVNNSHVFIFMEEMRLEESNTIPAMATSKQHQTVYPSVWCIIPSSGKVSVAKNRLVAVENSTKRNTIKSTPFCALGGKIKCLWCISSLGKKA